MSIIRVATLVCACLFAMGQPPKKTWTEAEVMAVHRSAILIDAHNDVTSKTVEGFDFGKRSAEGHSDLPRMKEGGMAAQFFAVYVAASYARDNRSAHRALQMIDTVRTDIAGRNPKDFMLATDSAGILAARSAGKIAVLMGIEGGHAIEDDLRLLRAFHDLGVRYMTLTHSNTNSWAASSGDQGRPPGQPQGLTAFGKQVIAEMNRLGMMVDIAHVSDQTFRDVLETSQAPVFSSHSSCRALSNIPRNMSDDMIRAMAKKGGVIQINFGCEFLSQKSADSSPMLNPAVAAKIRERTAAINDAKERRAAARKIMAEMDVKMQRATIDDVVAHIDHVKRIAGVEYAGLGSDFDGVSCVPVGLEDVSKWPNLTRKLLEKGYSPDDIRKIYGENTLRVMREVEAVARRARVK